MRFLLSTRPILYVLCLFFLFDLDYRNGYVDSKEVRVHAVHTRRLLSALVKIVGYYERQYSNFDVDGIYGLRVLEGTLVHTLSK